MSIYNDFMRVVRGCRKDLERGSLRSLIVKGLKWVITRSLIVSYLAGLNLRKHSKGLDVEGIVNLAYTWKFLGFRISPAQVRDEIIGLLKALKVLHPKMCLEIGTASGGTLFLFARVSAADATLISIDLPRGPFGGGYPSWKIPFYKSFAKERQKIYLIRSDSHYPATLNKVKRILGNSSLDFLFIDGDHTYKGVKKDFEMYSPLVREGGIIAFHDIVEHPPETGCEVSKFWNEIKHDYQHLEIVKSWVQKWAGIGVLYV